MEEAGLDETDHGESGYHDDELFGHATRSSSPAGLLEANREAVIASSPHVSG